MNDNNIWCVRTSPREGPLQFDSRKRPPPESFDELGSLGNDNGDSNGNEKSKKVIGLDLQNNNFARASRFFCLRCMTFTTTWKCLISRFVEDVNTRRLSFSFSELWYSLLEFNSRKICQHLTNWTRWDMRDKVWSSTNSLFKWRFRKRRRCCCLNSPPFSFWWSLSAGSPILSVASHFKLTDLSILFYLPHDNVHWKSSQYQDQ